MRTRIWGSESSKSGGLADTRVYKEVTEAKLASEQNPPSNGGCYMSFIVGNNKEAWEGGNPKLEWPLVGFT